MIDRSGKINWSLSRRGRLILCVICMGLAGSLSAQDDILGDLKDETSQNQTTAAEEAATADAATTVAPADASASGTDTSSDDSDESATGAETTDAEQETVDQGSVDEPGALEAFMNAGALGLLLNGGIFMWPILILGILAVGVIIERYRSLKMLTTNDFEVRSQVQQLLFDDQIEDALALCDAQQGPVPAVLSTGLRKYYVLRKLDYDVARTEEQVVKAMDDYSVHIVAGLEKHLPVLATVSSVAPMLGFLGTVQGMIVAFQQIVEQMGETNIVEAAASGIQVSLLTTCFGLIVGIPAFIAFNYFTSVINRFVLQVEQSATELIESVTIQLAAAGLPETDPAEGDDA